MVDDVDSCCESDGMCAGCRIGADRHCTDAGKQACSCNKNCDARWKHVHDALDDCDWMIVDFMIPQTKPCLYILVRILKKGIVFFLLLNEVAGHTR